MSQVTIKLGTTVLVNIAGVENEYLVAKAGIMPTYPFSELAELVSKRYGKTIPERIEIKIPKKITIEEQ